MAQPGPRRNTSGIWYEIISGALRGGRDAGRRRQILKLAFTTLCPERCGSPLKLLLVSIERKLQRARQSGRATGVASLLEVICCWRQRRRLVRSWLRCDDDVVRPLYHLEFATMPTHARACARDTQIVSPARGGKLDSLPHISVLHRLQTNALLMRACVAQLSCMGEPLLCGEGTTRCRRRRRQPNLSENPRHLRHSSPARSAWCYMTHNVAISIFASRSHARDLSASCTAIYG